MKHYFLTAAILGALALGLAGCGKPAANTSGDSNSTAAKAALASASPVPVLPAGNSATSNSVH